MASAYSDGGAPMQASSLPIITPRVVSFSSEIKVCLGVYVGNRLSLNKQNFMTQVSILFPYLSVCASVCLSVSTSWRQLDPVLFLEYKRPVK